MMTPDRAALFAWNFRVIRARAAYRFGPPTPPCQADEVCLTAPTKTRGGICRAHRHLLRKAARA